jgi:hypothetical protein
MVDGYSSAMKGQVSVVSKRGAMSNDLTQFRDLFDRLSKYSRITIATGTAI